MIIARENLIELLKMDFELETRGAIQYINHSAMMTGIVYRNIIKVLRVYAHQKIEHAMILADYIIYLGGYPDTKVGIVFTSESNVEMLLYDFKDEEESIYRYKIRIEQAEQLKEIGLIKRLRTILWATQDHAMYLKKQLCAGTHHGDSPNIRIIDTPNFSQKWAEKAINVPIRIKRQN